MALITTGEKRLTYNMKVENMTNSVEKVRLSLDLVSGLLKASFYVYLVMILPFSLSTKQITQTAGLYLFNW